MSAAAAPGAARFDSQYEQEHDGNRSEPRGQGYRLELIEDERIDQRAQRGLCDGGDDDSSPPAAEAGRKRFGKDPVCQKSFHDARLQCRVLRFKHRVDAGADVTVVFAG